MATPKLHGNTPNAFTHPGLSPQVNSPASLIKHQKNSPANFPLTFTPNTAAAAEVVAALSGFGNGTGRTPAFLQFGMPQDEGRKREIDEILRMLALNPGRISVEGIERLAKRLGLECWKEAKEFGHTVSLGGGIIVVDIDFHSDVVSQVTLTYANTLGPSNDLAHLAASILKDDLTSLKPPLISSLSQFSSNLERLSKLDKLSSSHSINCFTAVTGLYESLRRLFEHEKTIMDNNETEIICRGNGRPSMHFNGKVGLSIEYWKPRRKLSQRNSRGLVGEAVNPALHGAPTSSNSTIKSETLRVLVEIDEVGPECSSLDPVRSSTKWVGETVMKPSEDSIFGDEFTVDWLDPEPSVENLMEVDSQRGAARFIARLDPPIVISLLDEVTIFTELGLYNPSSHVSHTTLDGLLFSGSPADEMRSRAVERTLHVPSQILATGLDTNTPVKHSYNLHVLKDIYAREVWEIPFSHPKQLGAIFQIFRQYAMLATLLRSCFSGISKNAQTDLPQLPNNNIGTSDELDSFLSSEDITSFDDKTIPVDITLTSDPPTLKVTFPSRRTQGRIIELEVGVARNAVLSAHYGYADASGVVSDKTELRQSQVLKAIEAVEDLGIIVEWLRSKV